MNSPVIYTVHTYNLSAHYRQVKFKQPNENYDEFKVLRVKAKPFFQLMENNMKDNFYIPKFIEWGDKVQQSYLDFLAPCKTSQYPVNMPQVSFNNEELSFINGQHRARVLEFLNPNGIFIEVNKSEIANFKDMIF